MSLLIALLPAILVAGSITMGERLLNSAKSDWWINLQAWAIGLIAALYVLPIFNSLQVPSLIDGARLPLWQGFLLFLVVRDFAEFAYHRAQHSIPLLWSMHSLHHSDPDMSALTTQRHYWADQLFKAVTVWPLSVMIVAPSFEILTLYGAISLWHFFVHARLPISFGRWSWLLNSPAYHRRHHSSLPEHYNSNFAALFPIFDVICGSYHRPDGFPPTGLDMRPKSAIDLLLWPIRQSKADQTLAAPVVMPGRSAPMPEKPMEYPPSTGIVTPVT
jgi:sterol desaturase/sphingolipid hydroxylase (fatty acid hydroxylase superfamily)